MYDSIVIGAGYAGLMAAFTLMRGGHKVLLLAKGYGRTHLHTGAVDVLGYWDGNRVERPLEAVAQLRATRVGHPYGRLSPDSLQSAATTFLSAMAEAGYAFAGSVEHNLLMPTAVGVARPVALVPQTMLAGDLRRGGAVVIVGFSNFKDFYPELIAANLVKSVAGLSARSLMLNLPGFENEADVAPPAAARAFEQPWFRRQLAEQLQPHLQPGERIGLPALLGVNGALEVLGDLQTRLNARVFEIPTLPPSLPGMRLFNAFEHLLRQGKARVQIGHAVIGAKIEGRTVDSVSVQSAARPVAYRARHFVLATGSVAAHGLEVDSYGAVSEPLFNLPVTGVPEPGTARFDPAYFGRHPFNRIGVAVNEVMQPVNDSGQPVFENVVVCGALLAGAEPWKEKSGEGISLASAYQAAQAILESGK
jgi:glycerol-3-phosphate dehydrogenase subunit B